MKVLFTVFYCSNFHTWFCRYVYVVLTFCCNNRRLLIIPKSELVCTFFSSYTFRNTLFRCRIRKSNRLPRWRYDVKLIYMITYQCVFSSPTNIQKLGLKNERYKHKYICFLAQKMYYIFPLLDRCLTLGLRRG